MQCIPFYYVHVGVVRTVTSSRFSVVIQYHKSSRLDHANAQLELLCTRHIKVHIDNSTALLPELISYCYKSIVASYDGLLVVELKSNFQASWIQFDGTCFQSFDTFSCSALLWFWSVRIIWFEFSELVSACAGKCIPFIWSKWKLIE